LLLQERINPHKYPKNSFLLQLKYDGKRSV
jgi:hypothetical protein